MQALECKNNGYERKNANFKIVGVQEAEKGVTKKKKNALRLKADVEVKEIRIWKKGREKGVADRGASVRVGRDTEKEGKGYFKDRRLASNMDPYVVTSMMVETTILGKQ